MKTPLWLLMLYSLSLSLTHSLLTCVHVKNLVWFLSPLHFKRKSFFFFISLPVNEQKWKLEQVDFVSLNFSSSKISTRFSLLWFFLRHGFKFDFYLSLFSPKPRHHQRRPRRRCLTCKNNWKWFTKIDLWKSKLYICVLIVNFFFFSLINNIQTRRIKIVSGCEVSFN